VLVGVLELSKQPVYNCLKRFIDGNFYSNSTLRTQKQTAVCFWTAVQGCPNSLFVLNFFDKHPTF